MCRWGTADRPVVMSETEAWFFKTIAEFEAASARGLPSFDDPAC